MIRRLPLLFVIAGPTQQKDRYKSVQYVPYGHRKTMTFPAALGCDRIDAPCVFDGPVNAISFTAYVEQFLVPTLRSSDVVIAAKDMRSVRATLGAINRTRASPKGFAGG
jgi:hypothetical protein